jgi:phage shock protein A
MPEETDLMALINRMSRLFAADIHAVLDRIEEPDVLLKHAVREMEEELAHGEQRARLLAHELGSLAERQQNAQTLLTEIGEQLDVCFASRNDELCRKIIKRRLDTERVARHVAERRAALDKELGTLRATLDEQRDALDVMRQKAELLTATAAGDAGGIDVAVSEAEVEVAYLRERQRRQPS